MKSFKNLLDKIMFMLGYIPKINPQEHVVIHETKQEVVCLESDKRLNVVELSHRFNDDASMSRYFRSVEDRLAEELLAEVKKLIFITKRTFGDETIINMRIKVVKP